MYDIDFHITKCNEKASFSPDMVLVYQWKNSIFPQTW